MIYQDVNKRIKIYAWPPPTKLTYATSLIMFALPVSMPCFKSINFYQSNPKIKLVLQKNAKFGRT